MSEAQQIQTAESDVVIPLTHPYVEFSQIKADAILNGVLNIKFPNQCAWCNSNTIIGWRPVQVYEANPQYRSKSQQTLMKGAAMAAAYALGGNVLGQSLVYSAIKPQDAAKIKGVALHFAVPYCTEHASAPIETAFSLVNSHLRVRSAEYANSIQQANTAEGNGLYAPANLVEEIRQSITPRVKLSTYERVRWYVWFGGMALLLVLTVISIFRKTDLGLCVACGWLPGILVGVIWGVETLRKR